MRSLHIYGQAIWHDDVQIVGATSAIEALRDTLTEALERGQSAAASFYCADGEGYGITVKIIDFPPQKWGTLVVPYTDEMAADSSGEDARYMPSVEKYRRLEEEDS